jgi:hypothetical protein
MTDPIIIEFIQIGKLVLILAAVVWLALKLMDQYTLHRRQMDYQRILHEREKGILQLRLQACERLLLLLDRIALPGLISRVQLSGSSPEEAATLFMLAIQKEIDHNITQQLYISPALWQIILLIKEDLSKNIDLLATKSEEEGHGTGHYISLLFRWHQVQGEEMMRKAQAAIKEEATKIIG